MMRAMGRMYGAPYQKPIEIPGAIRTEVVNNVAQSLAIARPISAPAPKYSPPVGLWRPATPMTLSPSQPNLMMDPSDPTTWQRQYRFDG